MAPQRVEVLTVDEESRTWSSTRERHWDDAVAAAAQTVWRSNEVVSVYVVLPDRPTFHALSIYRGYEQRLGLRMSVMPTGGVVLERRVMDRQPLRPVRHGHHAPHWVQSLLMSTEGVR